MIRVGIVGFDTSHSVEFAKRMNHIDVDEEQWVEGARVVMGYPGVSNFASEELISERSRLLRDKLRVRIADSPEDMVGKVDAILLELQEGGVHLEAARPFLEAGLPTFIDKPFTCSVSDAKKLTDLARSRGVPLFSSSSLRYALEIQNVKSGKEEFGAVLGAEVHSPASLHPKNPGLFNYGIHGVEMLYSLMGSGCRSVWCIWEEGWETTIGRWKDGRVGTMRGIRRGGRGYGFTAFCEKRLVSSAIDTRFIYRELLKRVVKMFQTGHPPIKADETIEIVAFMEAAMESMENGGVETKIKA